MTMPDEMTYSDLTRLLLIERLFTLELGESKAQGATKEMGYYGTQGVRVGKGKQRTRRIHLQGFA